MSREHFTLLNVVLICNKISGPPYNRALLSDNEFITDSNVVYVKPEVIPDKQHFVCIANTTVKHYIFAAS